MESKVIYTYLIFFFKMNWRTQNFLGINFKDITNSILLEKSNISRLLENQFYTSKIAFESSKTQIKYVKKKHT